MQKKKGRFVEGKRKDVLSSHHLRLPRRPLAWGTAFVTVVNFLFDFVAELGVAVFFLGRHDGKIVCDGTMDWYIQLMDDTID